MSGPVNVLDVLAEYTRKHDMPEDLVMATLAVGELIDAANRARGILSLHNDHCQQLDDALARVGGAA